MQNKILIVEDNPIHFSVFKEALGHAWALSFVHSLEDAFEVLNTESIQLVILDVIFEDATAMDFMIQLSESKDMMDVPVVFMTAMEERHEMHKAMKLGGRGYIFKPLDIQEIQMTVRNQMKLLGE